MKFATSLSVIGLFWLAFQGRFYFWYVIILLALETCLGYHMKQFRAEVASHPDIAWNDMWMRYNKRQAEQFGLVSLVIFYLAIAPYHVALLILRRIESLFH
jgi:hypothetical protein